MTSDARAFIAGTRGILGSGHERIVAGCEAVFARATANPNTSVDDRGEKILSIAPN